MNGNRLGAHIDPVRPIQDLIIYELHVRGFTKDASSGVKNPGTFAGIREKIPYLKELGIPASSQIRRSVCGRKTKLILHTDFSILASGGHGLFRGAELISDAENHAFPVAGEA